MSVDTSSQIKGRLFFYGALEPRDELDEVISYHKLGLEYFKRNCIVPLVRFN